MIPNSFTCYRVYQENGNVSGRTEKASLTDLSPGDVVIKTHFSSINYKDALGATGRGKVFRRLPIIPGIDVAGEVISSATPEYNKGQRVLVTGCGLGESADGGYSEYVRVPHSWVVPVPQGLSTEETMILGTAGFTASLCLWRMINNGQTPEQGPILINGASGGVGSMAVQIFSQQGFEIIAVSDKIDSHSLIKTLGASKVLCSSDLQLDSSLLASARWAGAIDNVGGSFLSQLISHIGLWGNIACVGMAGGHEVNTSVFPLILRGVSLLGISSANSPMSLRKTLWQKLATEWKPKKLSLIHQKTLPLFNLEEGFSDLLSRKNVGRILVRCHSSE